MRRVFVALSFLIAGIVSGGACDVGSFGHWKCALWGQPYPKPGECPGPDDTEPLELIIGLTEFKGVGMTDQKACQMLIKQAGGEAALLAKYAKVTCNCIDLTPPIKTAGDPEEDAGPPEEDRPEGDVVVTLISEACDRCATTAGENPCRACVKEKCCDAAVACFDSDACNCLVQCVAGNIDCATCPPPDDATAEIQACIVGGVCNDACIPPPPAPPGRGSIGSLSIPPRAADPPGAAP